MESCMLDRALSLKNNCSPFIVPITSEAWLLAVGCWLTADGCELLTVD
jgi:hypothetical protein